MSDYKYVIVGGGMTADSAVKGIREIDKSGAIAVFSEEKDPPYNRPPLSKALWKGETVDSIWRGTEKEAIDFYPSMTVTSLDASGKSIRTGDGGTHHFEKLLLATGGRTRRFSFGGDDIIYFRTLEDYRRLRSVSEHGSDFVVMGAGFIGSEVAAALAMNGKHVTMIFPEDRIGARVYPRGLSSFLVSYYMEKGVNILSEAAADEIERENGKIAVRTKGGEKISADAVVAGLGIIPNDELGKFTGLATDNGIIVDEFLRTTNHDVYAAGDVANFYSHALDKRVRVEHEDNANTMGKIAGHNMAGISESYDHLPFFYSDLFDLGYEAVGKLDSRLEMCEDWDEEFRKGVVYYLKDSIIRGVLLWNTWGKVDAARELIKSKKKYTGDSLKGLIKE